MRQHFARVQKASGIEPPLDDPHRVHGAGSMLLWQSIVVIVVVVVVNTAVVVVVVVERKVFVVRWSSEGATRRGRERHAGEHARRGWSDRREGWQRWTSILERRGPNVERMK